VESIIDLARVERSDDWLVQPTSEINRQPDMPPDVKTDAIDPQRTPEQIFCR
jgi:hypothetical protein